MLRDITTVFLAGPMRGYPLYNFPLFDKASGQLRSYGYQVTSPADEDRKAGFDPAISLTDNFPTKEDCIKRSTTAIIACEAVFLLPGWMASECAPIEKQIAQFLHRELFLYNPEYPGRILEFPYVKNTITCPLTKHQSD